MSKKIIVEVDSWFSFWWMSVWLTWNGLEQAFRHLKIPYGDYGLRWSDVKGRWLIMLFEEGGSYYIHQYGEITNPRPDFLAIDGNEPIYQYKLSLRKRIEAVYRLLKWSPIARDIRNYSTYALNFWTMRKLRKVGQRYQKKVEEYAWVDNSSTGEFTGPRWENPKSQPRRVVTAANRYGDIVIVATRHHCPQMHVLTTLAGGLQLLRLHAWSMGRSIFEEQGFIDNYQQFLSREEAMVIARERNQFHGYQEVCGKEKTLFSEMLH